MFRNCGLVYPVSILMLAHPALSHSLNMTYLLSLKPHERTESDSFTGCGKDQQALNIVFHFMVRSQEADCSNCGLFYP